MDADGAREDGGMERRTVLVVGPDREVREGIGAWLDRAGHEVLTCPGPGAPDYVCIGGRGGRCVLAEVADVIVLDTWLDSSAVMEGTSSDELLAYYLQLGRPVVSLSRTGDRSLLGACEGVREVRWPPEREPFLEAVRAALEAPKPAP
jgi:CheY-like chemotaxis protein